MCTNKTRHRNRSLLIGRRVGEETVKKKREGKVGVIRDHGGDLVYIHTYIRVRGGANGLSFSSCASGGVRGA